MLLLLIHSPSIAFARGTCGARSHLPPFGLAAFPPSLISTDTLAAWLSRKAPVRVLDVRDVFVYLSGHVPEAQHLSIETLRASGGGTPAQLLDQNAYARIFSRLGLDPQVPVVVYSAGETMNIDATFVVWLLWSFGHAQVYLLDGGYRAWELEQRDIARRYPRIRASPSWSGRAFEPPVATIGDVRRAIGGSGTILVDARPADQYAGAAGAQMRRGHIPGAISHYWQDDLETRDFGRMWRTVDVLRASYAAQGITPDRDVILYCNTTTEASHLFFALKFLLQYPRVRIYTGSWTEWAERSELPVEAGTSSK